MSAKSTPESATKASSGCSIHGSTVWRIMRAPPPLEHLDANQPDVRARLGHHHEHDLVAAEQAEAAGFRFQMHEAGAAEARRTRRLTRLAVQRRRERRDPAAVLPEVQVRVDGDAVARAHDEA